MLRFRLKELIAEKEFSEQRRISATELARATGLSRNTISQILNQKLASVRTSNLEKLCAYFGCGIGDLVEYLPDRPSEPPASS